MLGVCCYTLYMTRYLKKTDGYANVWLWWGYESTLVWRIDYSTRAVVSEVLKACIDNSTRIGRYANFIRSVGTCEDFAQQIVCYVRTQHKVSDSLFNHFYPFNHWKLLIGNGLIAYRYMFCSFSNSTRPARWLSNSEELRTPPPASCSPRQWYTRTTSCRAPCTRPLTPYR